jgi:hypothetical protein
VTTGIADNLVAALIGFLIGRAWSRVSRILNRRLSASGATQRILEYDPNRNGLYTLNAWSGKRPLSEESLECEVVQRVLSDHSWLVDNDMKDARDLYDSRLGDYVRKGYVGHNLYLVGLAIDTKESEYAQVCRATFAPSEYPEAMALHDLGRLHVRFRKRVERAITRGQRKELFERLPPTSLSCSVVPLTSDGLFPILRRSRAVETFAAQWTVGANETLMSHDAGTPHNQMLYNLCYRCLDEEIGLHIGDLCSSIFISWLGFSIPAMCYGGVAFVRSRLTAAEVTERIAGSHSNYEHDSVQWLPIKRRVISNIVRDKQSPTKEGWSYLAPLVASELWRVRREM